MCVVVDINALALVFNEKSDQHEEFRPIKVWIERGKGFLVFGGTRYIQELSQTYRYLRLVRQLHTSGRAVAIRDDMVDAAEADVDQLTQSTDCDDQHIIALLGTSRCSLVCSRDSRSYKYLTNTSLYPKKMKKVRIYSCKKNRTLLRTARLEALTNRA